VTIKTKGCIFVNGWMCPVNGDEIPLEVCRLCIEARKTQAALMTVKRLERESDEDVLSLTLPSHSQTFSSKPGQDVLRQQLSVLDRQFENDQISLEEYIQRRKSIVRAFDSGW